MFTKAIKPAKGAIMPAGGLGRKFAPGRATAALAGLGLGAAGAKDAYSAATGGWDPQGTGNLGWHRQRLGGAEGLGGRIKALFGSPLKSLASIGAGPGPKRVLGPSHEVGSQGTPYFDPKTNKMVTPYTAGRTEQDVTWSPEIQSQYRRLQELEGQKADAETARQAEIEAAQKALESGEYGEGFTGSVASRQRQQEDLIARLKAEMESGEYGGGGALWWKRPDVAGLNSEIDPMRRQLTEAGRLGQQAAEAPPAPPRPWAPMNPPTGGAPNVDWANTGPFAPPPYGGPNEDNDYYRGYRPLPASGLMR